MKKQKIILASFGLLVVLQLWTPAAMIWNRETVLETGKAFKFRAVPVDPTDPFRGKYLVLSFLQNRAPMKSERQWAHGETIFVQLQVDGEGFANVHSVHKKSPGNGADFVTATVAGLTADSAASVLIEWPFNRFYMEENKAYGAEQVYHKSLADSNNIVYALVRVKNGNAVLDNVFINDKPIVTYLK